ncbi:MAG: thermonuclease family protein [Phycisphaerae bacterium]
MTTVTLASNRRAAGRTWRVAAWSGVGSAIGLAGLGAALWMFRTRHAPAVNPFAIGGSVRRVVGDHVHLKDRRRVEFAGIRLPFEGEPSADTAREKLTKWLDDRDVRLTFDALAEDGAGRPYAYLFVHDRLMNERLVRSGLAFVKLRGGQRKYADVLLKAQSAAQAAGVGVWATIQPSETGRFIGDLKRATFHAPNCNHIAVDGPPDRIEITGTAAAFSRGLAPCGHCLPCE